MLLAATAQNFLVERGSKSELGFSARLPFLQARWLVGLVLVLGFAFSAAAFFAIRARDRELVRTLFEQKAREQVAAMQLAVERGVDAVSDAGALFDAVGELSRSQFQVYAAQVLASTRELRALNWVVRVPAAERVHYEMAARKDIPHFQFLETNSRLELVPAGSRAEYFPVYYLGTRDPQSGALGYDQASAPSRLEAIDFARDTGRLAATGRIPSLGGPLASSPALVLFRPVYRGGIPSESIEQRRSALVGFTLGVFTIRDLIGNVLDRFAREYINVTLYDLSAPPGGERFLGVWPANAPRQPEHEKSGDSASLRHSTVFEVGGRQWLTVLVPNNGLYGTAPSTRAWSVLVAGLLFSLLLAAYLGAEQRNARLMREQAITDELTGLYNRRYLLELLPREVARARRYGANLAAVMVDIDYFKRVNDTLGHQAGDLVLKELGALLKDSVRESDVACRYGGEEFLLILPEVSLEDVQRRAEALRLAVAGMRLAHRGRAIGTVTVSIGLAMYPDHASDAEALIRCADQAMYEAKKGGRDTVAGCTCVRIDSLTDPDQASYGPVPGSATLTAS